MTEFDCPFCDGAFQIPTFGFYVLHSDPPCQKFLDLEVTDFMRAVNAAPERE